MTKTNEFRVYLIVGVTLMLNLIVLVSTVTNRAELEEFRNRGERFTACDGELHEHKYHGEPFPSNCDSI